MKELFITNPLQFSSALPACQANITAVVGGGEYYCAGKKGFFKGLDFCLTVMHDDDMMMRSTISYKIFFFLQKKRRCYYFCNKLSEKKKERDAICNVIMQGREQKTDKHFFILPFQQISRPESLVLKFQLLPNCIIAFIQQYDMTMKNLYCANGTNGPFFIGFFWRTLLLKLMALLAWLFGFYKHNSYIQTITCSCAFLPSL